MSVWLCDMHNIINGKRLCCFSKVIQGGQYSVYGVCTSQTTPAMLQGLLISSAAGF